MDKVLKEIIKLAKEALVVTNQEAIVTPVKDITKTAFISVGGVLDSIILVAEDAVSLDPTQDNIDRPEKHNIAGTMNSPSETQKKAFAEENNDEI